MNLVEINTNSKGDAEVLYELLEERTPEQSISHKRMPTFNQHRDFIKSNPYKVWYFISVGGYIVGSTYITHANELGIFIFKGHQGKGYAREAIKQMMGCFDPPFYANINPHNFASRKFFSDLGFNMIQITYALGAKNA